jgi:UDP:flavonoid glycosyltransferase YjiC (YdhE family)
VPFTGRADYDATRMFEAFPGLVGLEPGIEQLNHYVENLFINTIPDQHAVMQKLLAEAGDGPVVVIHESTFAGMWPVMLGGPGIRPAGVLSLGISPVPVNSEDTAPFGMGLPPDSSPAGKARNRQLNAAARQGLRTSAEAMERVLAGLGVTGPLPYYFDGQVLLTDASRPGLNALADLDALVVVTTVRENDDLGPVPENARVARYIPYEKLLPHVNVVVSNGGFGGVQQTLGHGVPLVLAGETEDKKTVTAVAAYTGAATNLATTRPSEEAIRRAVDEVLTEEGYRKNAERLRNEYASYRPFDNIARVIEEFARTA